jgi:hypothetical protein
MLCFKVFGTQVRYVRRESHALNCSHMYVAHIDASFLFYHSPVRFLCQYLNRVWKLVSLGTAA